MNYYKGHPTPYQYTQEGHGLGSILSSIAKTAIPFVKTGARFLGREVLRAGCDVGDDVLSGQTVKQSIRKRVFGQTPQEGSGVKRIKRVYPPKRNRKKKKAGRKQRGRKRQSVARGRRRRGRQPQKAAVKPKKRRKNRKKKKNTPLDIFS
jgi:hypothetical protein